MNKFILSVTMLATLILSPFASAVMSENEGLGMGATLYYANSCEAMSAEGMQIMGMMMTVNGITEENLVYQPGLVKGYQNGMDLGCANMKMLLVEHGMYRKFF